MPSIVIAQGGGPTAVINQTLCGAILAAREYDPSLRMKRITGSRKFRSSPRKDFFNSIRHLRPFHNRPICERLL